MRVALVLMAFLFAIGCGGSEPRGSGAVGGTDGGSTPAGIVAISLSQTDVHIPVGTTTAFAVTGTRTDGTRVDVTPQADTNAAAAIVR